MVTKEPRFAITHAHKLVALLLTPASFIIWPLWTLIVLAAWCDGSGGGGGGGAPTGADYQRGLSFILQIMHIGPILLVGVAARMPGSAEVRASAAEATEARTYLIAAVVAYVAGHLAIPVGICMARHIHHLIS